MMSDKQTNPFDPEAYNAFLQGVDKSNSDMQDVEEETTSDSTSTPNLAALSINTRQKSSASASKSVPTPVHSAGSVGTPQSNPATPTQQHRTPATPVVTIADAFAMSEDVQDDVQLIKDVHAKFKKLPPNVGFKLLEQSIAESGCAYGHPKMMKLFIVKADDQLNLREVVKGEKKKKNPGLTDEERYEALHAEAMALKNNGYIRNHTLDMKSSTIDPLKKSTEKEVEQVGWSAVSAVLSAEAHSQNYFTDLLKCGALYDDMVTRIKDFNATKAKHTTGKSIIKVLENVIKIMKLKITPDTLQNKLRAAQHYYVLCKLYPLLRGCHIHIQYFLEKQITFFRAKLLHHCDFWKNGSRIVNSTLVITDGNGQDGIMANCTTTLAETTVPEENSDEGNELKEQMEQWEKMTAFREQGTTHKVMAVNPTYTDAQKQRFAAEFGTE